MTDKITEPMTPEVLDPVAPSPLAGDWNDDDAAVYQDDFIQADHGPDKFMGVPHTVAELPPINRLVTRSLTVGTLNGVLYDPVLLLSADPHRIHLLIQWRARPAVSNTGLRIADDRSKCFSDDSAMLLWGPNVTAGFMTLDGYTGPLWGYSADTANYINISVAAVTS